MLVGHLVALRAAVGLLWATELQEGRLEVGEGSFDEGVAVFEMDEQMMPERMFREDFRIAEDDQAVFGTGEGDVQPTWVAQEADALMVVGTNAG